nr:hypothetical protein CFP56_65550 [Quercus suber]
MTILTSTHYITVPLTTTFTPPVHCVETTFTLSAAGGYDQWPSPGGQLFRGADPSCFPDGFGAATEQVIAHLLSSTTGRHSSRQRQFVRCTTVLSTDSLCLLVLRQQPVAPLFDQRPCMCCTFAANVSRQSEADEGHSDTINGASNVFSSSGNFGGQSAICWGDFLESAVIILSEGATTTLSTQEPDITASAILIAWQSSDIITTPTGASPGSTITSVSSPTVLTVTRSVSATASAASGLSTGAQAGIGVGTVIAGIALLAVAGFFFLRRRKSLGALAAGDDAVGEKAELPGQGLERSELATEQTIHEKDGGMLSREADGGNVLAELDGNWRGHEFAAQNGGVDEAQPPTQRHTIRTAKYKIQSGNLELQFCEGSPGSSPGKQVKAAGRLVQAVSRTRSGRSTEQNVPQGSPKIRIFIKIPA